jgi:hypothetical protein
MFSAATKSARGPNVAANFVEDVFSTWLYTGTATTNAINNGIDLASKGGMVWIKNRTNSAAHGINDTVRGTSNTATLCTNSAGEAGEGFISSVNFSSFNSNGFTITGSTNRSNATSNNFCSWTFRDQPKFFDVVTYTGNGANRTIAHNLGSVPGMIIVKRTDDVADWQVYHRSLANTEYLVLNTTAAKATGATRWNSTTPTSSVFSLGTDATVNASGGTYVAYVFAHDAGGFGTTGTDNVISCGGFTTDGSGNATVSLGYEPQYVMFKSSSAADNWWIVDSMRGIPVVGSEPFLAANSANAENQFGSAVRLTATGFTFNKETDTSFIYIAIRRPMKVPTVGTEVFNSIARTGTGANATVSPGFVTDTVIEGNRTTSTANTKFAAWNRLRGVNYFFTPTTAAEIVGAATIIQANPWDVMDGYKVGTTSIATNASGNTFINWMFKRASGFHDVVCYTGTGANRTLAHNLTVVPELMIVKGRSNITDWNVYSATLGATKYLRLNAESAENTDSTLWNASPTSSVFSVGSSSATNGSGNTFVAYLFATLAGVSKVGSYTGNGTTQAIACGFTGGARFVLIKRTDSLVGWYVYDTARGMTALTNPYLFMNSTAAEVATLGSVTTTTGGFTVNAAILAAINTNAASYIFLAIA